MENRQRQFVSGSCAEKQPPLVSVDAVNAMSRSMDQPNRLLTRDKSRALMSGHFVFYELAPGLTMHCSDATELQDVASSSELADCLSFNFLLAGNVQFSLGKQRYSLASAADGSLLVAMLTAGKSELLTRYTCSGEHVTKVNLAVSRQWLEQRSSAQDREKLEQLFRSASTVRQWRGDRYLLGLVRRVLALSLHATLQQRIALEALAQQVLGQCLNVVLAATVSSETTCGEAVRVEQAPVPEGETEWQLMQRIEQQLAAGVHLDQLARSQGMSVSTLQRRFKKSYGITVMDHVRRRRLEMARAALVFEGRSIGEAAYAAGYDHPSNFIAAFKREFCITPSDLLRVHHHSIDTPQEQLDTAQE